MTFEWLITGAHFERFVKLTQNKKVNLDAIRIFIFVVFYVKPVIKKNALCVTQYYHNLCWAARGGAVG